MRFIDYSIYGQVGILRSRVWGMTILLIFVNFESGAPVTGSAIIFTLVIIPLSHIQTFFKSFVYLETAL